MYRRLFAIVFLLAVVLQGPVLTFAVTLASNGGTASHDCSNYILADEKAFESCCTYGSMPSCAAQCPVPMGAAVPVSVPITLRMPVLRMVIPDADVASFPDYDPPHLLRPPIA